MKKKIIKRIVLICSVLLIIGGAVAIAFATGVVGGKVPTLDISAMNLSFSDSVYIKYAVACENADVDDVKLLIWTAPQSEYIKGSEDALLENSGTEVIDGVNCIIFNYKGLAAKQMTDVIYARAYVKVGTQEYYSEAKKYSVLQYAYNKMGKTSDGTDNEKLITLLEDMLNYGALAQNYTGYKTDTLATDNFSQIQLGGGVLEDNFNHGLYKVGTTVTIKAAQTCDGMSFVGWRNSAGEIIATTTTVSVTVGAENETYFAVYKGSAGNNLEYMISPDGFSYSVCGIGDSTSSNLVIPSEIGFRSVTAIEDGAFKDCTSIKTVNISKNIKSIGAEAFSGCTGITTIYFGGSKYQWNSIAKGENWNAGLGKYMMDYAGGSDEWELGGIPLN